MNNDFSGIFKPEAKNVLKIFSDSDSYFQVPDYQRPYSWDDEQIEQLWDDIITAKADGEKTYFLGPVILINRIQDGYYEVVDGQQRLTTLTILFCVLRDLYFPKDNKILNTIKSLVDNKFRLRLVTQNHYQNQFEQEILEPGRILKVDPSSIGSKSSKFINAALIFRNRFQSLAARPGYIAELIEYILHNVVMISIVCTDQSFAIKLFQILNTRGLDLNPADLIKSHLYGRCDQNKHGQFIATWRQIETLAAQSSETLDNLLTLYEYYLLAQNPKKSLYEELIAQFKDRNPNEIVYEIKEFILAYNDLIQSESKIIYSLCYLPNKVFWQSILTVARFMKVHDFDDLCKVVRKLYYSYWIAGYTTSKVKQISFTIIALLKQGGGLDMIRKEVDKKLIPGALIAMLNPGDNVRKRMYENLNDEVYNKAWLKPILILIEYNQTDDSKISFIELGRELHVDHILPEMWHKTKDWNTWDKQAAIKWLNRIGNLTLLSGRKNIAASNNSFQAKKDIYRKGYGTVTAFEISKRVAENDNWLPKQVADRQGWMIQQIEIMLELNLYEYGSQLDQ
jgi:uncharacterized protein with ParB-like and HNH nuclease domain